MKRSPKSSTRVVEGFGMVGRSPLLLCDKRTLGRDGSVGVTHHTSVVEFGFAVRKRPKGLILDLGKGRWESG